MIATKVHEGAVPVTKTALFLLALCSTMAVHARATADTFHVDAIEGDDANVGSEAEPWRTLAHVGDPAVQAVLRPGDSVLLRRGQTFPGPLVATASGTEGMPVTYGAYGAGARPIIDGAVSVSGWTLVEGGVWEADCPGCASAVSVVTIDGQIRAMGRYPNADAPNGGYLTAASVTDSSITDPSLSSSVLDWLGAEVVVRANPWIIDRHRVTAHSESTLSFERTAYSPQAGFGYFLQDDARTLDATFEWYFDRSARRLRVVFGDAPPASSDAVRIGAVDTLVRVSNTSYVTLDGLALIGANSVAIEASFSTGLRVHDCEIRFTGRTAIEASTSSLLLVEDSAIAWTNNIAMNIVGDGAIIRRNTIGDTALFAGMGANSDGTFVAINVFGDGSLVEGNAVERTGYHGIYFQGNDVIVRDNFVDEHCLVKDDGAGIYTFRGPGGPIHTGRLVTGNIVLHGRGAPEGTRDRERLAHGLYIDDRSQGVTASGNTFASNRGAGIFLNIARDITLIENTVYDNDRQVLMKRITIDDPLENITSTGNLFFSRLADQNVLEVESLADDFRTFGAFEGNRYARPLDDAFTIVAWIRDRSRVAHDVGRWQRRTGLDGSSQGSAVTITPYVIRTVGENLFPNERFDTDRNNAGAWSRLGSAEVLWTTDGMLDGGAIEYRYSSPSGAGNASNLTLLAGPVSAGGTYLVRFSARSSSADGFPFEMFLRDIDGTVRLSGSVFGGADVLRSEHEYLLVARADHDPAIIDFEINESDARAPFWLDNVGLYPADVDVVNPDEVFLFEHNRSDEPRSVLLDEPYVDAAGTTYSGDVVIPPHASLVLMRGASVASPVITSSGRLDVTVGDMVDYAITALHSPTSFGAEGLPPGLVVDAATGLIRGTPTIVGTSLVLLSASNAHGTGTKVLELVVPERGALGEGGLADGGLPDGGLRDGGVRDGGDGPRGGATCGCSAPGTSRGRLGALGAAAWLALLVRRRRARTV